MDKKNIYINKKPVSGPWGGGTKFVRNLTQHLTNKGYNVTYDLQENIDLIFCFDPRPNHNRIWYQDLLNHKFKFGSKIIQRIGDIGTHSKPDLNLLVKESSILSDYVIFPSFWAKEMINYEKNNFSVIENAPLEIFYQTNKPEIKEDKIKVVTHHWSTNEKKGFDYYSFLGNKIEDELLDIEFTYIGRYNENFSKRGIKHIQPLDEKQLSLILPSFDVYLTASLEEAGANHVLEAMACNLPVVYRQGGGSINEYCEGMGIEYTSKDEMIKAIQNIKNNRITELMEVLEEVEGKAIIWAHWRHDIDTIVESIEERYPESVVTYYGDTTTDDRQKAIKKIQDPESKVRFLVGTPQTGGYGITLTGASTMIYYSNGYDLEKRQQSEARIDRIGQKKPMTYIDIIAEDTIDEKIVKSLRKKVNIATEVMGEELKAWI